MIVLAFASRLDAPAEAVWAHATSAEGINHELAPWLRMTLPSAGLSLASVRPGVPLGRSWLLLGGALPVDFDDLCLAELRPFYFREQSTLLSQRAWQHEREVVPQARGCELRDRLTFAPRVPGTGGISRAIVRRLFQHRHRRVQARFGGMFVEGGPG
jgi:ligand-binding SRPBCC domain-containing protein